jgi:hypothetical protein
MGRSMEILQRRNEKRRSEGKRQERSLDYGETRMIERRQMHISKEIVRKVVFDERNLDLLSEQLVNQTSVTVQIVNQMIRYTKMHFTRKDLDYLFDALYERDFFKQFSKLLDNLKNTDIAFILEL